MEDNYAHIPQELIIPVVVGAPPALLHCLHLCGAFIDFGDKFSDFIGLCDL
jgi:hypothetical protein